MTPFFFLLFVPLALVQEAEDNLPADIRARLITAGCVESRWFEEPETSLGTFAVGATVRVGGYDVQVESPRRPFDPDELWVSAVIINANDVPLPLPVCARNMSILDEEGSSLEQTGCSWSGDYDDDEIPPGGRVLITLVADVPEDAAGLVWRFSADTVGVDFMLDAPVNPAPAVIPTAAPVPVATAAPVAVPTAAPEPASDDDHADSIEGATAVMVAEVVQGTLDDDNDADVFVFQAEVGVTYQIDVELGTLGDSTLALFDSDEWELAYNDDHGDSFASRIVWPALSSGEYYVVVAGFGTGSYTLTVAVSDIVDDHANSIEGAAPVSVGEPAQGGLDYDDDRDFFVFEAETGVTYQVDVELGTLGDSWLALFDSDEWELAYNDDRADSLASRIVWTAPGSGRVLRRGGRLRHRQLHTDNRGEWTRACRGWQWRRAGR